MNRAEQIVEGLLEEGVWGDKLKRLWQRRDPEGRQREPDDNASMPDRIRRSEQKMQQARTHELKAPKMSFGQEEDRRIAARQPFTAWAHADEYGPHPDLARVVKGSPYERSYRQKYPNEQF